MDSLQMSPGGLGVGVGVVLLCLVRVFSWRVFFQLEILVMKMVLTTVL